MPDDIKVPVPVTKPDETQEGEEEMPDPVVAPVDAGDERTKVLLAEGIQAHQGIMTDAAGTAVVTHGVLNNTMVKKFNREDPIEAAAVEMMLGLAQV